MIPRSLGNSCVMYALFLQLIILYLYIISEFRATHTTANKAQTDLVLGYQTNSPDGIKRRNRIVNKIITEYDEDINGRFQSLVNRKAEATDQEMIRLIREMMDPPSRNIIKTAQVIADTPQSKQIKKILKKKKGFFVECGGLNGEATSNTIHMNHYHGWTGLIVEMDPFFYTSILGKNRKAWTLNACMSPYPYPIEMEFKESTRATGTLLEGNTAKVEGVIHKVPCFPFESMLLALNTTKIDYFSLDVEGFEMEVLKTVNFNKFDISTLSVEYIHGKASEGEYRKYMEDQGFLTFKNISLHDNRISLYVDDFIFVKQNLASKLGLKGID